MTANFWKTDRKAAMRPPMILLLSLIMTIALYWAGLSGPFIFDDFSTFEPIRLWVDGQASLLEVIFPNASLVFSRPVAMASFVLTTWLFGDTTFSFKIGNLIIHLGCGVLGWLVLRRGLTRDAKLRDQTDLLAALVVAFWLLHPLHVSTVLYAVQRMAQLSTFFTLLAVWIYLVARQQLVDGNHRSARLNLFVSFPLVLILGLLSKQNAAVVPALCLVMELAYFSGETRSRRSIASFFSVFLVMPLTGLCAILLLAPEYLLRMYAEWDFTLWERLITQPRALMDYIGMLLFPRGPLMGLYTDNFAISRGLLSPPATLFALLALVSTSVAAITLRKRAPSVFAGWFFFLVAHSVESSFLPLEMYYEHRNYLPSLGLLLAVFGLVMLVPSFKTNVLSPRRLGLLGASGFLMILCIATFGRVLVWQRIETIVHLGVQAHPDSSRAHFDVAAMALQSGDYDLAQETMRGLVDSDNPRHRQLGRLSMLTVNCMRGVDESNLKLLKQAAAENLPRMTTYETQAFLRISNVTKHKGCVGLKRSELAAYLRQIVDATGLQPETAVPKMLGRYALSEIYARDGQWIAAQSQAEIAWEASHDQKVGAFLATIYIQNGQLSSARALLAQLDRIVKPYDKGGQQVLGHIRNRIAEETVSSRSSN